VEVALKALNCRHSDHPKRQALMQSRSGPAFTGVYASRRFNKHSITDGGPAALAEAGENDELAGKMQRLFSRRKEPPAQT
jgi:hypothetical protein